MADREVLAFEAVEADALYWLDEVDRFKGIRQSDECTLESLPPEPIDEAAEMNAYGVGVKELIGDERAEGFRDTAHVMRFIVGAAPLPSPIDDGHDGDIGALVCV
ncbi:MAG TPA: hypothetical protein VK712_02415 [Verrucomicrobiae bacterium]|jgi:hypothetical protein|nr:hypothetical protein [Verrucomicrobiae bacterium]